MARRAREVSGTGIYHVMMRGINRQNIFEDAEDYSRFIELLYQMVYPVDDNRKMLPPRCVFYAYCLMTNHVHLLIRETSEGLSSVIKRIGVSYAQYYNKKYLHFGHLFQDRFRSEPVNDNAYFFTLLQYIHQNPVAAGITKDVASYQWSSWVEYERAGNGILAICSTKTVLSRMLTGGQTPCEVGGYSGDVRFQKDADCLHYLYSLTGKRLYVSSLSVAQLISVYQKKKPL